jgi:hypothetical protein
VPRSVAGAAEMTADEEWPLELVSEVRDFEEKEEKERCTVQRGREHDAGHNMDHLPNFLNAQDVLAIENAHKQRSPNILEDRIAYLKKTVDVLLTSRPSHGNALKNERLPYLITVGSPPCIRSCMDGIRLPVMPNWSFRLMCRLLKV